jgi:hypothetical protein
MADPRKSTVVQFHRPPTEHPVVRARANLRTERLLAAGAMISTRSWRAKRAGDWLIFAFVVGGAFGLSYHILAPALVAALKVVLR